MEIKTNYGVSRPEQGSSVINSNPAPAPVSENSSVNSESLSNEVSKVNSNVSSLDTESERKEPTQDQIKKAVAEINKRAQGTEAIFGIHEATNRVTIKIVDKNTKDVIKELPAEKTLDLIAKAWEMAGILVDEKR